MADITDYVSGSIINKFDILSGREPAANVIAYVEGIDDVFFWEHVLSNYPKYKFKVTINRSYQVNGSYPNGKAALMHINGLSKEKIVCVDADLDLIVRKYSSYSSRLCEDPFVFNTQYYSIENVLSQPELLAEVVKNVTGEYANFNFATFMKYFSNAVFDIFLLYLACIKGNRIKKFSLEDFKCEINKMSTKWMIDGCFSFFKTSWHSAYCKQISQHNATIIKYKDCLKQMGYKGRESYKLLQGHCLYNCFVKHVLLHICRNILEKRLAMRVKISDSPDKAVLKNEIYSFPDGLSFRDYIDRSFYRNSAVKDYVPVQLRIKLTAIFN